MKCGEARKANDGEEGEGLGETHISSYVFIPWCLVIPFILIRINSLCPIHNIRNSIC